MEFQRNVSHRSSSLGGQLMTDGNQHCVHCHQLPATLRVHISIRSLLDERNGVDHPIETDMFICTTCLRSFWDRVDRWRTT